MYKKNISIMQPALKILVYFDTVLVKQIINMLEELERSNPLRI
jgi:hypothetical protein